VFKPKQLLHTALHITLTGRELQQVREFGMWFYQCQNGIREEEKLGKLFMLVHGRFYELWAECCIPRLLPSA
jgi:hypothetical protein